MEELLSLKWNNHRSTFIHVLGILRDKQLYTDATLACDGKFYSVHKLVLSTCSDYFSAMLDRTNCKNPVIVLKDIKCEDLEALLDYMYLGEVNVRQSDLATLIKAAECLRVKGLAVPDDEPPPRKTRPTENQSRRGDTSGSPPAKRKRRSDVEDGREDVRPVKVDNRHSSPVHSSRPKSPSSIPAASTPLSPVHNRSTPQRQPSEATVPPSPNRPSSQQPEDTADTGSHNNQSYSSDQAEPYVKVEMDDGGDGNNAETYDLSNDGAFKEEGDDGGASGGGGGESGGDLSNDLPEFLQQAAGGPLQAGAFGHSSFSGPSSFQPGDMPGWQGDGSNIGFPHLNFGSTEGSSQQNAPGGHHQQYDGATPSLATARPAATSSTPAAASSTSSRVAHHSDQHRPSVCKRSPGEKDDDALWSSSQRRNPGGISSSRDRSAVDGCTSTLPKSSSEFPSTSFAASTKNRAVHQFSDMLLSSGEVEESGGAAGVMYVTDDPEFGLVWGGHGSSSSNTSGGSSAGGVYSTDGGGPEAGKTCQFCGKSFLRSWHLQRHLRSHTGERPFPCPVCPYRATHRSNLQRHMGTVHGKRDCQPHDELTTRRSE